MTDLGKVGVVTKGTWSNSATYEVLDMVSYAGAAYIAKQAVPEGTLPTNETYWQPAMVSNGAAVDISSAFTLPDSGLLSSISVVAHIYGNLVCFSVSGRCNSGTLQNKLICNIDNAYKPNAMRVFPASVTIDVASASSDTKSLAVVMDSGTPRLRTPNEGGLATAVTANSSISIAGSYFI